MQNIPALPKAINSLFDLTFSYIRSGNPIHRLFQAIVYIYNCNFAHQSQEIAYNNHNYNCCPNLSKRQKIQINLQRFPYESSFPILYIICRCFKNFFFHYILITRKTAFYQINRTSFAKAQRENFAALAIGYCKIIFIYPS